MNKLFTLFILILLSSSKTSFGGFEDFIRFSNETSAKIEGLSVIAELKGKQLEGKLNCQLKPNFMCDINIPIEVGSAKQNSDLLVKKISFKYKHWGLLEYCCKNNRNYFIFKEIGDKISYNFDVTPRCWLILSPLLVQSRLSDG